LVVNDMSRLLLIGWGIRIAALLVTLGVQGPSLAQDQPTPAQPQFALATGSPITVGFEVQRIVVTELDADGNLDIVLTCGAATQDRRDATQGYVAALKGDGRGGFELVQPLIPFSIGGLKAAAGDLNKDNRGDIVVVAHDSYTVTILLQNERGRFDVDQKTTIQASNGDQPHTHDVALADVNGDGSLDILTTNEDDCNISVLLGDGAGEFRAANGSPFAAGQHPYEGLSLSDLNRDHKLDVVVPNLHGQAVSVLLGDGAGGFVTAQGSPFSVGDRPGFVALGDVTGDSRLEIIATHDDDPIVYVLRDNGRGEFQPTKNSPLKLDETVWTAVVADMNDDGNNDLILGGKQANVLILLGVGDALFDPAPVLVPVGGRAPFNLAVADVNRDGKADLVTSNYESGNVSVLLQQ
jgi:hypothetical protein